jgi:SAM-dependent methyltransferase
MSVAQPTTTAKPQYVISPNEPLYREAIARELDFWSHVRVMTDKERVSYPSSHPLVVTYLNTLFSGNAEHDWLDYVIAKFHPKGRAASLGSGIGFYERRLLAECAIDEIDLYELCPANLDRARTRLEGRSVGYHDVDLNFAELPVGAYDLIISRFFLHHIVNLEHLLQQVNRALTETGIFVLFDYIGDSRYRWSEAKKKFINGLLDELRPLGIVGIPLGEHPGNNLIAPDDPAHFQELITNSPFETIRSEDIASTLDRQFSSTRLLEVKYGAVLHAAFRTLDYSDWDHPGLCQALKTFIDLDQVATANGLFKPCGLFGIYGKGLDQPLNHLPWTDEKIRSELLLQ